MSFDLPVIFFIAFSYMLLLFLVAYATDQGWLPAGIAKHPVTFALSLCVYATSWTYYGSVGFAVNQGYNFLTIYIGVSFAFLLTPVLLMPLLRLTREYQLTSLADLFAFRYRSQTAGIVVTLFMLIGVLPYMALQIEAVTESISILSKETSPNVLAFGFCATLTLFAILFGARHISPREKHEGLVVAIAFESAIKLIALLVVGLTALFGVWGGFGGLNEWLQQHPEAVDALYRPVTEGPWRTLLLLAFAAAFLLPRQFHMIFTENIEPRTLSIAAWLFPLFLLFLNLPIPLIMWAGQASALDVPADYYVLGLPMAQDYSVISVFAFIGGISAASAMMIVTTLALASMCLNHLLLPASFPDPHVNLYRKLLWGRRVLIGLIIMLGYGFYRLLEHKEGLVQLGLISFVAVAQFLPGIAGVLFWRRSTRAGFLAGLLGGIAVWVIVLLLPLLQVSDLIGYAPNMGVLQDTLQLDKWEFATFATLTVNITLFIVISSMTRQSQSEQEASEACCSESLVPPMGAVTAASPKQFEEGLARAVGSTIARKEVGQALSDLGMGHDETRPVELRRLREQLERNLSGLIGPQLAHIIVNQRLELNTGVQTALADSMRYVESKLEDSRSRLRGLAAELEALHRYHRQILADLPLGVCALGQNQEIVIWNLALELLSGVPLRDAQGRHVEELPEPWGQVLSGFANNEDNHVYRHMIDSGDKPRWINLHKATISQQGMALFDSKQTLGTVFLLEDLTDLENLEAELVHSERLASIGRLAAGVAHEVGNPVTGIACLAQNLRDENDSGEVRYSVEQILEQTKRISNIVQSLTTFSHGGSESYEYTSFSLHDALEESVRLVRLSHQGRKVECGQSCPVSLLARGDRQRLVQVLVNLLSNACDASSAGDKVEIIADSVDGGIGLEIYDHGVGILEEHLERIFEPFFTTKPPGEGTGLGLPMVYKIIHDHGGTIDIESEVNRGTHVRIWLPGVEYIPKERYAS